MSSESATDKLQASTLMGDSDLMEKHDPHAQEAQVASGAQTSHDSGAKPASGHPQHDKTDSTSIHDAKPELGAPHKATDN